METRATIKKMLLGYVFLLLLNVFFWDRDPKQCAKCHGSDKHVHKMIVEYAQIASTAYRLLNECYRGSKVYRKVQPTSNVVQWAAASRAHYMYVVELGLALGET